MRLVRIASLCSLYSLFVMQASRRMAETTLTRWGVLPPTRTLTSTAPLTLSPWRRPETKWSDDTLEQRHNDEPERHRRATTLTTGHIEAYGRNWKGETLG